MSLGSPATTGMALTKAVTTAQTELACIQSIKQVSKLSWLTAQPTHTFHCDYLKLVLYCKCKFSLRQILYLICYSVTIKVKMYCLLIPSKPFPTLIFKNGDQWQENSSYWTQFRITFAHVCNLSYITSFQSQPLKWQIVQFFKERPPCYNATHSFIISQVFTLEWPSWLVGWLSILSLSLLWWFSIAF